MNYPKKISDTRWIVQVQSTGGELEELFIELPQDALSQVGWEEGDVIEWFDNGDKTFTLVNVGSKEDAKCNLARS